MNETKEGIEAKEGILVPLYRSFPYYGTVVGYQLPGYYYNVRRYAVRVPVVFPVVQVPLKDVKKRHSTLRVK